MNVIAKEKNDRDGTVEYHLFRIGSWDLFDDIAGFFEQHYGAEVHHKTDGICTRKWQMRCRDEYFFFEHHEDIGNWFYSCSEEGDSPLMQEIANELEKRLGQGTS